MPRSLHESDRRLVDSIIGEGICSASDIQRHLESYRDESAGETSPALADFLVDRGVLSSGERIRLAGMDGLVEGTASRRDRTSSDKRADAKRAASGSAKLPQISISLPGAPEDEAPAENDYSKRAERRARRIAEEQEIPRRLGGYELLGKIGRGGMGTVFKARQITMDRVVALKVLPKSLSEDEHYIQRFQREARSAGTLNHPNVVQVYEVNDDQRFHFFSMEHVDGMNLQHLLRLESRLEPLRALKITIDVAKALEHAEKHKIIHRDVKPDNILVTRDARVKLADLGLAKSVDPVIADTATKENVAMGTPFYMAVEQGRNAHAVDNRADIYALGATFYHTVTGQVPYDGENSLNILMKAAQEPLVPPAVINPEVPAAMSVLIERMMAKRADDRYQNSTLLLEDLHALEEHLESGASAPMAVTASGRLRAQRPIAVSGTMPAPRSHARSVREMQRNVLVGLSVLLFTCVIVSWSRPPDGPRPPAPGSRIRSTPGHDESATRLAPMVSDPGPIEAEGASGDSAERIAFRNAAEQYDNHEVSFPMAIHALSRIAATDKDLKKQIASKIREVQRHRDVRAEAELIRRMAAAGLLADDGHFADAIHLMLAFPPDLIGGPVDAARAEVAGTLTRRATERTDQLAERVEALRNQDRGDRAQELCTHAIRDLYPIRTASAIRKALRDRGASDIPEPGENPADEQLRAGVFSALVARLRGLKPNGPDDPHAPLGPAPDYYQGLLLLQRRVRLKRADVAAEQKAKESRTEERDRVRTADQAALEENRRLAWEWNFAAAMGHAGVQAEQMQDPESLRQLHLRIDVLRILSAFKTRMIDRINVSESGMRVRALFARHKSDTIASADTTRLELQLERNITLPVRWNALNATEYLAVARKLAVDRHSRDRLALGALLFLMGHYDSAVGELSHAAKSQPEARRLLTAIRRIQRSYDDRKAKGLLKQARDLIERQRGGDALTVLGQLVVEYSKSGPVRDRRTQIDALIVEAERQLVTGGLYGAQVSADFHGRLRWSYPFERDRELRDWSLSGTRIPEVMRGKLRSSAGRAALSHLPILAGNLSFELELRIPRPARDGITVELFDPAKGDKDVGAIHLSLGASGAPSGLIVGGKAAGSAKAIVLTSETHRVRIERSGERIRWLLDGEAMQSLPKPGLAGPQRVRIELRGDVSVASLTVEGRPTAAWLKSRRAARAASSEADLKFAKSIGEPASRRQKLEALIAEYQDVRVVVFQAEFAAAEAEIELGQVSGAVQRLVRARVMHPHQASADRSRMKSLVDHLKKK